MKIVRVIKKNVYDFNKGGGNENNFVFPYSSDNTIKRQQIWNNLQKGLLFEGKRILIPWLIPYNKIDNLKLKLIDSGDRTICYLGKQTILDGYEGQFEVVKWISVPKTNPIVEIYENIGHDHIGHEKFNYLRDYITNLLGDPAISELEKFDTFDLGFMQWENGIVKLKLIGIEHFSCRYTFSIGLIDESNQGNLN